MATSTRSHGGKRPQPGRRLSTEVRRAGILAGAGAAFARSGFADTSMAEIAALRAGVRALSETA